MHRNSRLAPLVSPAGVSHFGVIWRYPGLFSTLAGLELMSIFGFDIDFVSDGPVDCNGVGRVEVGGVTVGSRSGSAFYERGQTGTSTGVFREEHVKVDDSGCSYSAGAALRLFSARYGCSNPWDI